MEAKQSRLSLKSPTPSETAEKGKGDDNLRGKMKIKKMLVNVFVSSINNREKNPRCLFKFDTLHTKMLK